MRKRITSALVTLGVVTAGLLAVPSSAGAAEDPDCALWAETPVLGAGVVTGTGFRDGCVQNRQWITVRIRKDVSFWPDETLAERTVTNRVNTSVTAVWDCKGNEGGVIFTEILTNAGGKAQSPRRGVTCND